jgi:hypothetical protein
MIQVESSKIGWWPVVVCDVCGGPLSINDKTIVIWSEADPPRPAGSQLMEAALHVHEGNCDQRARERLNPPVGREDLEAHLLYLVVTLPKEV